MSPFNFLLLLYVTFIVISWRSSISWLLCNTGKYFLKIVLILGSIVLYCVIKLYEVGKLLLVLSFLAFSLEVFLPSENCFLTLLGLYSLAIKHFWYSALSLSNLLSESHIFLTGNTTPLGMSSMSFYGKQVLGSIYVKLLVALEKLSRDIYLDSLSNLSLRPRTSKTSLLPTY